MNILVSSGTSDAINTNQRLRQRISHGFNELGHLSIDTSIEELPQLLELRSFDFLLISGSIADLSVDLVEVVRQAQSKNIAVAF